MELSLPAMATCRASAWRQRFAAMPALESEGHRTKRYTSTTGRTFGGRAFSRGHLYCILSNRIYRGEIVHQDASYPGDHRAIIDPALWDRVQTRLAGTLFRVELNNKHRVLATICGKMRKRWVRITAGDRVKMEMSPYDLNKARITWRIG